MQNNTVQNNSSVPNPPVTMADLQAVVANQARQLEKEKRSRIEAVINRHLSECRITASEVPAAIERAMLDENFLNEIQMRSQVLPGFAPVDNGLPLDPTTRGSVVVVNDDVRNVLKAMKDHIVVGPQSVENATTRGAMMTQIFHRERTRLTPVLNAAANNIDAALKRVLILNETVRAFATRVLPLRLFSSVFSNVPLQGTDQVEVPYYPLQAAASSDFNVANGYQFDQATNTQVRQITVNKRKYQPLDYSSQEFRRQPWLDTVRLGAINAEKLGVDILNDILSVITLANFGAAVKNLAPGAWTSDDIADLKGFATKQRNWPDAGRALIIDSDVDVALSKDPAYKNSLNIGTPSVIQGGTFPKLSGFEVATMANFPTNGENLIGVVAFASAIGAAFAPVDPADGVRAQLVAYEVATDPATGISMNYRKWGLAQADRNYEIIESAYGYDKLVAEALGRLTKP